MKDGAHINQEEHDHYWNEVAPLNRNPRLNQVVEKPLIRSADYASALEAQNIMQTKKVKMKKDFVVSKTGIDAYEAVEGEELELPELTADGLVRDELAEYSGPGSAKSANSPAFGDSDHVAAVRAAQKEKK
jgi:hypothetical protein